MRYVSVLRTLPAERVALACRAHSFTCARRMTPLPAPALLPATTPNASRLRSPRRRQWPPLARCQAWTFARPSFAAVGIADFTTQHDSLQVPSNPLAVSHAAVFCVVTAT